MKNVFIVILFFAIIGLSAVTLLTEMKVNDLVVENANLKAENDRLQTENANCARDKRSLETILKMPVKPMTDQMRRLKYGPRIGDERDWIKYQLEQSLLDFH